MKKKQPVILAIILAAFVGYFSLKLYINNIVKTKIDEEIAQMASYADIQYKNIDAGILGLPVSISEVSIHPTGVKEKIKINEIVIEDVDSKEQPPTHMSIRINGMEYNSKNIGDYTSAMQQFGYPDTLLLNIALDYAYEKEKQKFIINKITVGAKDVGEILLSLHAENINLDSPLNPLLAYAGILFHQAKMEYTDSSLVERIIQAEARQKGTEVQDLKKEIIHEIQSELDKKQSVRGKKACEALEKFIENPKKISISVAPEKPQSIQRILSVTSFEELLNLLNIQITS